MADVYNQSELLIGPETLHFLVYEHLVHHCYSATAEAFGDACGLGDPGKLFAKRANTSSKLVSGKRVPGPGKIGLFARGEQGVDGDLGAVGQADMDVDNAMETDETNDAEPMDIVGAPHHNSDEANHSTFGIGGMGGDGSSLSSRGTTSATPLQTLPDRQAVYRLIADGNIAEAIQYCQMAFPDVLIGGSVDKTEVEFELQCQRFIELVRTSAVEAMAFAQEELGKFDLTRPDYAAKVNDIVALIAYPDPLKSPLAKYLAETRRIDVATLVNSYILASHGYSPTTAIETLARQATVVREMLHQDADKDSKKANKVGASCCGAHDFGLNAEYRHLPQSEPVWEMGSVPLNRRRSTSIVLPANEETTDDHGCKAGRPPSLINGAWNGRSCRANAEVYASMDYSQDSLLR
ncbi:CTLH/CRA C-terminal to lish motif domain-containing protein [Fimicolochytrium jonesii]|uniref:CTLH/CRA C-terminal to lish motif domain-containing protein n=1 Tax=Fimicolochytrium jonesii TaxID=1396493 RepID=UPI0022FDBC1D|nr:CTLH/CRA C-terminal to lish motif domain-containing protein [Fimicolochytrium jonesii]KAI8826058.1 CTLH/CRA C-terminal to lish motif domain-containing protein [Fimicolochytrium jonesii]